ncbi:peptidoglycan DD-metalloendopeptidase family protein [Streptomyces sp. KLOTTS4A1]|uniref:M23 family metallopeptidase n=1 Tax=Streptomyces sp. KLOTTS4A1 TaxID=3390996 RepID=UPI0039F60E8A
MNEQHGHATGHGGYATGAFDTTAFASDPLFGSMPGAHDAGQSGQWDSSQWTATADPVTQGYGGEATQAYGSDPAASYDAYAAQSTGPYEASGYSTGGYDTTAMWASSDYQPLGDIPAQAGPHSTEQWDTTGAWQTTGAYGYADTGTYDATAWNSAGTDTAYGTDTGTGHETDPTDPYHSGSYPTASYTTGSYETLGHDGTGYDTSGYDTSGYDTGGYDTGGYETLAPEAVAHEPEPAASAHDGQDATYANGAYGNDTYANGANANETYESGAYDNEAHPEGRYEDTAFTEGELLAEAVTLGHDEHSPDQHGHYEDGRDEDGHYGTAPEDEPGPVHVVPHTPRPRSGSRGRRRTPAKRSALLTVAVPSVCALGVAGVAAASVAGSMGSGEEPKTQAAPDPGAVETVAANSKLDTRLAALSADADDFADRASRTQERLDLKARQEAEKKRKAEEAARKEALRPKFSLPVKRHGLSAYYGQAGVNWMSVHSGIDFPVSYGTPVLAATDGTVRTQWNGAYGNMAIVTAPDGTETWYCHLSSTKIRSGSVKAGDVIAYSGNSGNSTGPHLHFEVRPAGGSAINPLTWLRNHGLDPT